MRVIDNLNLKWENLLGVQVGEWKTQLN